MGTLQVGGTTLATKNVSTGKVDLHDSNVILPTGTILQVVGKTITDNTISLTENSTSQWYAVEKSDGSIKFEVDLIPKQTNSNFHIILTVSLGGQGNSEGAILVQRGYDASGGTSYTYSDTGFKGDAQPNASPVTMTMAFDLGSTGESSSQTFTRTTNIFDQDFSYASGGRIQYKVYWRNLNNDGNIYFNRPANVSNAERALSISSIVVYEIAGT